MQYPWIPSFCPAFVAEVGIVVVSIPAYLLLAFRARCTAVSPAHLGSLTSRLYSTASQKAHNKRARPAAPAWGWPSSNTWQAVIRRGWKLPARKATAAPSASRSRPSAVYRCRRKMLVKTMHGDVHPNQNYLPSIAFKSGRLLADT